MQLKPCPWCQCPMTIYANPNMGDPVFTVGVDVSENQTHADSCPITRATLYRPFALCDDGILAGSPEEAAQKWDRYIDHHQVMTKPKISKSGTGKARRRKKRK